MMDYTMAAQTPAQSRRMLACVPHPNFVKALRPEDIRTALDRAGAANKNKTLLSPVLSDMAGRENTVLILNLAGDDASAQIDAYLTSHHAALPAYGAALLARAGNCAEILVYAPQGTDASELEKALREAHAGDVRVVLGPSSQVLREDTALYAQLDRGEIWPDPEGHAYLCTYPSQGWQNRPTLVVDGETACNAYCLIAQPNAPQTKLIVIKAAQTLLAEVVIGTPVGALLRELGLTAEKAPLLGGMLGRFVPVGELEGFGIEYDRLSDSITLYTKADCMADACAALMREGKEQSCCKCVMCREGSYHLSLIFTGIVEGKGKREDLALAEDIAPLIAQGSLCSFGKAMPGPALSALALHRGEIEAHVIKKTCPAGTCAAFLDYVIDPMLCTGCGLCIEACEDDAIEGRKGFIHMIDPKACVKCGKCREACPENAVLVGADIRVPRKLTKVGTFNAQ